MQALIDAGGEEGWGASTEPTLEGQPPPQARALSRSPGIPQPLAVTTHTAHTPVTRSHSSGGYWGCPMLTQLAAYTVSPLQAQQVRVDVGQLAQRQQLQHARRAAVQGALP